MPWLLKPYPITNNMPLLHRNFNYRLSRARMTAENALGRLKGRWRVLLKRSDLNVEDVKRLAKACFVLHNICESKGEPFHPDWLNNIPVGDRFINVPSVPYPDGRALTVAKIKRDMVAEYLMNDGLTVID
ncbi:uncharacterized protein LOC105692981 [Athalia rosae]|uniref:uncharacterized protein LOC105692981 n=1 Tax=Athalia rosae TaxID=37344 RepID=UPI0020338B95|nr:uncharacterized protein LOC105692981 [Athalia rosae]